MRWLRFAVLICLAAVLQAGVINIFAVSSVDIKPDLLLVLLVFFAVYCNTSEVIITSFTIGFVADLISIGSVMGLRMVSFGLLGTLLAYLHRVVAIRKMSYQAGAILIVSFLSSFLVHLLSLLAGQSANAGTWGSIFAAAVYTAVAGPFLFLPLAWSMRIKTSRFGRK